METLMVLLCASAGALALPKYQGYEQADWSLAQNSTYETRSYPAATWLATNVSSGLFDHAEKTGFWRLFSYIMGQNAQGVKMGMTVPVTTTVYNRACSMCDMPTTVSYYLPSVWQNDPPNPMDNSVFIDRRKPTGYYVRIFHGNAKANDWFAQVGVLRDQLIKDGLPFDQTKFIAAGYDGENQFLHRRNEVWIQQP